MKLIITCNRKKDKTGICYIKFTRKYEVAKSQEEALIFGSLKYARKLTLEFNIGKNGFDNIAWEANININET